MPTINYGSILQMYCVGFTDTLTLSVPLQILKLLAADKLVDYRRHLVIEVPSL